MTDKYRGFTRHDKVMYVSSEALPMPIVVISIIATYAISDQPDELLQYLFEIQPKNELVIEIDPMTSATITWGETPADFKQKRYRIKVLFKQTGAIVHGSRTPWRRFVSNYMRTSINFAPFADRFPMIPASSKHWHIEARQLHRYDSAETFMIKLGKMMKNV